MNLILFIFIIEVLCISLFKSVFLDHELVSIIIIFIHAIFTVFCLYKVKTRYFYFYFLGYMLRLIFMFWDLYAQNIFQLIGSGGDTEGFFYTATLISNDLSLLKNNVYGGLYSKILGVIGYVAIPERALFQYINVLLGLYIILETEKILNLLNVKRIYVKKSLILVSFFPLSIIHSSILLRENVIIFLIISSVYNITVWYLKDSNSRFLISIFLVFLASRFHSGAIFISIGYIFGKIFYDHKSKRYIFSLKSIMNFIFIILPLILFVIINEDALLGKLNKIDNLVDLVETSTSGSGGSEYLTKMKISNPFNFLLFIPIKLIYFLASPVFSGWRGLKDFVSFLLDGLPYFIIFVNIMKLMKSKRTHNDISIILLISLISFLIVFAIGINNAGTAMRHRNKIFSLMIVLLFYLLDMRDKSDINTTE